MYQKRRDALDSFSKTVTQAFSHAEFFALTARVPHHPQTLLIMHSHLSEG